MHIFLPVLLTGASVMIAACTEQHSATQLPPGKYERTTSATDAAGTTTERETTTDVTVDEYGHKRAVVKKKTTKDPRGLLNKRTSESREVIEER